MQDSVSHSFQKDRSDEEDDENNVGIDGRDPNDKRVLRDTLNDALKLETLAILEMN